MAQVTLLDPQETSDMLAGAHSGKNGMLLQQISDNLMAVLDSEGAVWVEGLISEGTINSLRTRMYRRDVMITVRKATRNGTTGRIITARRITPGDR